MMSTTLRNLLAITPNLTSQSRRIYSTRPMANKKFSLIVAVCENNGIGINGNLPWNLKNELKYFSRMTKKVNDPTKCNAVIMGRKTYFCIPENRRPLPGRINVVLSTTAKQDDFPEGVLLCRSLEGALDVLGNVEYSKKIENVWIVGGSSVYEASMLLENCHRLYFTEVKATFDCDTFFPEIPNDFKLVENDDDIPNEVQEENGISYQYKIYEKFSTKSQ